MGESVEADFIQSCLRNDAMAIRHLLDQGADVDQRIGPPYDYNNATVLHRAAANGFTNTCSILLANGAYVETHDDDNWTPLQWACAMGHYGVARQLLEYGASLNSEAYLNTKHTPINLACKSGAADLIQLLIDNGASVNIESGRTSSDGPYDFEFDDDDDYFVPESPNPPLYTAYINNNQTAVKVLLDNNATCNLMGRIHIACHLGSQEALAACIIGGEKINARDCDGRTPLHVAVRSGHADLVKQCIQYKAKVYKTDSEGRTPLHYATENGYFDIMKILLKHKVAVLDCADKNGLTPLTIACRNNNRRAVAMLLSPPIIDTDVVIDHEALFATNDIEIVSRLLEYGACVNTKDVDNSNLLHKACQLGDKALVDLIMEYRPKLNGRQLSSGYTPLHIACKEGHTDIALTLIRNGAHLKVFDVEDAMTPLHMACETGDLEIAKAILEKSGDYFFDNPNLDICETPLDVATKMGHVKIVAYLLEKYAEMNLEPFEFRLEQPLLVACKHINPQLVQLFLKYKCDIESLDNHCQTPLVITICAYLKRLEKENDKRFSDVISILILLISHGCRLEYIYTDMKLLTELHHHEWFFSNRLDVTRFLLLTGIDIMTRLKDSFLAAVLQKRDFETLRVLATSGFVFDEIQLEAVCFQTDDGDESLLSCAREVISHVPSLQNLCRLKIRRIIRTNMLTMDELRRRRHLSSRIGDYLRKVTGKKRKQLPIYGIDKQIHLLPIPARIKDYLCFHLFEVSST